MQKKIKKLNEKTRKLSAFKPFQAKWTDIVAYRVAIWNQKGCPMVYWINCMQKIKDLTQEMRN